MDHNLSNFILKLYQHTSLIDENDFQKWAMEQSGKLIPFDSGQWGEGHIDKSKRPVVHRVYLYKQPLTKVADYHAAHKESGAIDMLALGVAANPSKTLCWRDVDSSDEALWKTPFYVSYAKKYEENHLMATAIPHYGCEFFSVISMYRRDKKKPFSDEEKKIKEIITPHLIESYRICLQSNIFSKLLTLEHKSIALVNSRGALYIRTDIFIDSLNKISDKAIVENTIQDQTLLNLIKQEHDDFVNKIRLTSRMLPNGLFLVVLHQDPLLQKLTPREIEAAILHKQGKTYEEIGEIMGIAKNTVSQFLRNVRAKYGVSNIRQIDL